MLYFDTSFIVPLLLAEATSKRVQQFFRRPRQEDIAISHWTCVEVASTFAREVRMGRLSRPAVAEAEAMLETVVDESFIMLTPDAQDYILARDYLGVTRPACAA